MLLEIDPSVELAYLLDEFSVKGGVLDFAFFEADTDLSNSELHKQAATQFLSARARDYQALSASFADHPARKNYVYVWQPEKLTGEPVSFEAFWGIDDVASKQLGEHVWSVPHVTGYKSAFFVPPYNLSGGIAGNTELFEAMNRILLGEAREQLSIWAWSTDCSSYFEAGREWWGAFLWTVSPENSRQVVVIAASATD